MLTTREGTIFQGKGKDFYDEIVVAQEAQICPAYVIELEMKALSKIKDDFTRDAIAGELNEEKMISKKPKHAKTKRKSMDRV